jgi:hypothetical protein
MSSHQKVYKSTLYGGAVLIVTNPPIVWFFLHNPLWFRISLYMQMASHYFY